MDRVVGTARLSRVLLDAGAARQRPVYRSLAQAIRERLLDGQIPLRARMPAERELAQALAVSRTTVSATYDLLRDEGYLRSRRGAGSWTALPHGSRPAGLTGWRPAVPERRDIAEIDLTRASPTLAIGMLDGPVDQALAALGELTGDEGYEPFGQPTLRAAIAERYTARGVPTTPDQILVTSGAQQALHLVTSLLCAPGDRIALESPTYPNAIDLFRRCRLRMVPIPVGDDGWSLDTLHTTLRQGGPRLAYLLPDFHNPTGQLMAEEYRAATSEAARHGGVWLVIDETISEIALDVPAPRPFVAAAAPGRADHIVTLGSMGKSHWGGLRIGWIRATPRLVTELAATRAAFDMAGSVLDQLVAVPLLRRSDEVLAALRTRLRARRDALVAALSVALPGWRWRLPAGGLVLWVDLGRPVATDLAERAGHLGVSLVPGPRFGVDPGTMESRLRVPYTRPAEELTEAVDRIATAMCDGSSPPPASTNRSRWVA